MQVHFRATDNWRRDSQQFVDAMNLRNDKWPEKGYISKIFAKDKVGRDQRVELQNSKEQDQNEN